MATTFNTEESQMDYSTLEAVDPQPPRHLETEGLQSTHLYGDEILNGKEVVKEEGIEVTRDDDKEAATSERAKAAGGWKRRRVCGIPMLALLALVLLLVIGGSVGGALGGTMGKKKEKATTTVSPVVEPSSVSTTSSATQTPRVTYMPAPNGTAAWYNLTGTAGTVWYNIINVNNGTKRSLRTTDQGFTRIGEPQIWTIINFTQVRTDLYYFNPFWILTNINSTDYLLNADPGSYSPRLEGLDSRASETSWWYATQGGEQYEYYISASIFNVGLEAYLGYDNSTDVVRLTNREDASTEYWFWEKAGYRDPSHDTWASEIVTSSRATGN